MALCCGGGKRAREMRGSSPCPAYVSKRQGSSIPTSAARFPRPPQFHTRQIQSTLLIYKNPPAMPIPESPAFLAKKPTVPPTFEGVDYEDNRAVKSAQDAIIREQWVRSMMARIVREELGKCYYRQGVNHLQNCNKLRERYLELLKDAKIKGYLFEMQNILPGEKK